MSRRMMIVALVLCACGIGAVFLSRTTASAASDIVEACAREGESDHSHCYERDVPALWGTHSLPELFEIIRDIRQIDPSYQFCHVLAHKLGEQAAAEDPSRWVDLIPLNPPDGICSNGFIHGVIVGTFRNDVLDAATLEKIIPDFARACEPRANWTPSPLDQAICYHGMGHLFMFVTNADIRKSLDTCDRIALSPTDDFRRVCREGVFMQIYQPLEPDDFALIELLPEEPSKENYRRMCDFYSDSAEEEGACLREAWPLFEDGIKSGRDVAAFCKGQPNTEETAACYESASAIIGRMTLGNIDAAAQACAAIPAGEQATCYVMAAQAIVEEDRSNGSVALMLCKRAEGLLADNCLATLAGRAGFLFTSRSREGVAFCALFNDEQRTICENSLAR